MLSYVQKLVGRSCKKYLLIGILLLVCITLTSSFALRGSMAEASEAADSTSSSSTTEATEESVHEPAEVTTEEDNTQPLEVVTEELATDPKEEVADSASSPAEEVEYASESTDSAEPLTDGADGTTPVEETDASDPSVTEQTSQSGVLTAILTCPKDGGVFTEESVTWKFTVRYDADAGIPGGSELIVSEVAAASDLDAMLATALEVGESRRILTQKYFSLVIKSDGQEVVPQTAVEIEVQTDAIDPTVSDAIEMALLTDQPQWLDVKNSTGRPAQEDPTTAQDAPVIQEETGDLEAREMNAGEDKTDLPATTCVSTSAQSLGTLGLATIVEPKFTWSLYGKNVTVWGARTTEAELYEKQLDVEISQDTRIVHAFGLDVKTTLSWTPSLWITSVDDLGAPSDVLVDLCCWGFGTSLLPDVVFGPEGTSEPTPLSTNTIYALLWQDASTESLTEDKIVEEEADVAKNGAADKTDADDDLFTQDEAESSDDSLADSLGLSALADNATTDDGESTFGTLLFAQADTASSFDIISYVSSTTYRKTKVYFVDTSGNALQSTITEDQYSEYRGDATDLYAYADYLSSDIADDYDFSRAYLQLSSDEKDCRYLYFGRVGDINTVPTATGSYRVYFYMESLDESKSGGTYNGTWYTFSSGGAYTDSIYLVFTPVQDVSFYTVDEEGNPVEGATFTAYTDSTCLTALTYNDTTVTGTSDENGLVSFGRIPYGTYYMKETTVPSGYKNTGTVYDFTVDGSSTIDDVVNYDDDGSTIVDTTASITFAKVWSDDYDNHTSDEVTVALYETSDSNTTVGSVTLNYDNDWTDSMSGLDPTATYAITETSVTSSDEDVTSEWIPTIEYENNSTTSMYYLASTFHEGQQYVLTYDGSSALSADGSGLTTTSSVTNDGTKITSTVTSSMLWEVTEVGDDGVITLQNAYYGTYLNHNGSGSWYLDSDEPQFVRFKTNGDYINMYYRKNLNNTTTYYLNETSSSTSTATNFTLYRKVDVKTITATVTNNPTLYPIRMQKLDYSSGDGVEGATFQLYKDSTSNDPLYQDFTSDSEGNLEFSDTNELYAGTYYLVEVGAPDDYAELSMPVAFTITRGGRITMDSDDKEFSDYTYVSSVTEDETTYPLLRVPNKSSGADVSFKKIDGYGNALGGATFTVYEDYDCTSEAEIKVDDQTTTSVTSDDSFDDAGNNVTANMPLGTLYMKETTSPDGYESNDYVYQITVNGEYDYEIVRMSDETTEDEVPDISTYGIMNTSSTKRKAILRKMEDTNMTGLAGAVFQILAYDRTPVEGKDIDGNTTTTFTSGTNGVYFVGSLPVGTYYLYETTVPDGYASLSTGKNWYTLTVDSDGAQSPVRLEES